MRPTLRACLLALIFAAPAAAQLGGKLPAHDHSKTGKGGATLKPTTLAVATSSFVVVGSSVGIHTATPGATLECASCAVVINGRMSSGVASSLRVVGGSVSANAFFGDGSALTGLSGLLSGGINGSLGKWTGTNTMGVSDFANGTSSATVYGGAVATFTVANTGIITAPSQSGARAGMVANKTFPKGVLHKVYWSSTTATAALYNNQAVIDIATDSATFYVRGTGLYAYGCQIYFQNPGEATTLQVEMVFAGGAGAILAYNRTPGINGYDSAVSVHGVAYMTAGQNVTCRLESFAAGSDPVITGDADASKSYAYLQKLW